MHGCSAHWLNLLGGDLTPPDIMKHITDIESTYTTTTIPLQDCQSIQEVLSHRYLDKPDGTANLFARRPLSKTNHI